MEICFTLLGMFSFLGFQVSNNKETKPLALRLIETKLQTSIFFFLFFWEFKLKSSLENPKTAKKCQYFLFVFKGKGKGK